MRPHEGRKIYDHVRESNPSEVLDLGTAHGVSAAYMAAALEANGHGHVTSVESMHAEFRDPTPEALLDRLGLSHLVKLDRSYSSYTWFLKEEVEERSDAFGNCDPKYDLCYLDGSKNWTVDGLAVVLIEKLLKPDGWLLMDDLDWMYSSVEGEQSDGISIGQMSEAERTEPHLRAVFNLIVSQHPSFTELRIEDGWWGWARKAPGLPRKMRIETSRSLSSFVVAGMRGLNRRVKAR
jgi:predicted O-methyltransferase YrrM